MYAILELAGTQYKVAPKQVIEVNQKIGELKLSVTFDRVLLFCDGKKVEIGQPYVEGVTVEAEVLAQTKAKKVIIFKYLRRKDSHKKTGHRQDQTRLLIKKINN
ncbi:MAG: 50S ribosomal protein L21 [Candidatus Omnitrophica bacterium]|nr:50S ribosomal protein L21 [Candidatus Omnitrophota bacterium]MBU1925191.1 50S ribosomal protein L21 [Candidatus Omnitrophota bacterium]MBU2063933.1 50S ribosomal protein L21 [Candidatus Omnitrophota bacterium]